MEKFTVAVCGGSTCTNVERDFAFECGKRVAEIIATHRIVHGAGPGFPNAFVSGFVNGWQGEGNPLEGLSPWSNHERHLEKDFPLLGGPIRYTGLGMSRNALIVQSAQAGIFFRGDRETMVEMLCASKLGRHLLVHRSGPAAELIEMIIRDLGGTEDDLARLHFFTTPDELVDKLGSLDLASVRQLEW